MSPTASSSNRGIAGRWRLWLAGALCWSLGAAGETPPALPERTGDRATARSERPPEKPRLSRLAAQIDAQAMDALDDRRKLGIGDRLSYRVMEDFGEAISVVITDNGEIELPILGRHKAADKTCKQLAKEIKARLEQDYYYRATVVIAVDSLNRARGRVYLIGAVRTPGPVELPPDEIITVSKVILKAGGFTDFADRRKVKITRAPAAPGGAPETVVVDVNEIWEKSRTDKDLPVKPDDMIYVPEAWIRLGN
jgi:protein involved in polysaccharide export with SLBB domain